MAEGPTPTQFPDVVLQNTPPLSKKEFAAFNDVLQVQSGLRPELIRVRVPRKLMNHRNWSQLRGDPDLSLFGGKFWALWTHKPRNGPLRTPCGFHKVLRRPVRGFPCTGCTETVFL